MGQMSELIRSNGTSDKDKVLHEMKNREIFSHNYTRFRIYNSMFCPRCCCPEKRKDRQWKDAASKLGKETDIMEVIKNMRLLKLMMLT
jgi:hypothetical protein